jgi:hypothetical protein
MSDEHSLNRALVEALQAATKLLDALTAMVVHFTDQTAADARFKDEMKAKRR